MIGGTGVPDDCQVDSAGSRVQLRRLLFKEVSVQAFHPDSLNRVQARVRIVPAHGTGTVIELLVVSAEHGSRRMYALPDTVVRTGAGSVKASALLPGHVILPSGDTVQSTRLLFVQADFCSLTSVSPVYVPVSGMHVLTGIDRNQKGNVR